MKLFRRISLFLLLFLALTLVVAVFFGPKYVESKIKEVAKSEFLVDLSYEKVAVDLFGLQLELDGVVLKDANTSELLLSNKKASLIISKDSFFTLSPVVENISLDGLFVNLKRDENGALNFEKHLPKTKKTDVTESKREQYFDLRKFAITNAKISVKDELFKVDETVGDINLSISNLSNNPKHYDRFADANLSLSLLGAKIAMSSMSKPFSKTKSAKVSVELTMLDMDRVKKYLPKTAPELSGVIGSKIEANVLFDKSLRAVINTKVWIDNAKLVLDKRGVGIKELLIIADECKIAAASGSKPEVEIKNSTLVAKKVDYQDKNFAKTFSFDISDANLSVADFRPLSPAISPFSAFVGISKNSTVSLDGKVDITNKKLEGKLDVKSLSLLGLKSIGIIPPKLDLASADLFANGNIAIGFEPKMPKLTYSGKGGLQNLSLYDKQANRTVLGFDNLNINGIDFNLQDRNLKIASINIEGLKADLKINKDKEFNLQTLFETKDKATHGAQENKTVVTQKPFKVSIGAIVLQNGNLVFEDEHVKPNFKANLSKLSGRVTSLHLDRNELSKIELIGIFNNQGQINIKGLLVPNPKNFYLNVKSDIRDITMPSFSTYTSKFIGYEIDSGKLGLELDYNVIGKELSLGNKISLFGFNLGREVENPTAVKLPYNLAIAILKDSNDNIHIELPVEGRTDDPQIRSGKVVWKLVSQLITKIITAPFKFIGSLFGGGDEMGYMEFDYGRSVLGAVESEKLSKIIKALKQKPELKVQIEGFVDGENDFNALKSIEYHRKLATQKLKDLKKPLPLDEIDISAEEHDKYLAKAYKAEKFPKPTNMLGFEKTIPSNDMKNLILTHIEIGEKTLLSLSFERAKSVRKNLLDGGVEDSRMSIGETKLAAPTQKEKVKNSRAEIKLLLK